MEFNQTVECYFNKTLPVFTECSEVVVKLLSDKRKIDILC